MTLYEILEVKPTASAWEIKRGYKRMVKKYHPDKNPHGEEMFIAIQGAYEILSNPLTKAAYDKKLHVQMNPVFRIRITIIYPCLLTGFRTYLLKEDVVSALREAAMFFANDARSKEELVEMLADMFERMR